MTDFQMSLIAAGGVFVVGVLSYNKWQEYKARKSVERAFSTAHDDALMKGGAAPAAEPEPGLDERPAARQEPVLDTDATVPDALVPGLKGVEYVALAGELFGMPRRQAQRRAHEVLTYLELEDARYRKLEEYSTGMKQRLKLGQALVHDPPNQQI